MVVGQVISSANLTGGSYTIASITDATHFTLNTGTGVNAGTVSTTFALAGIGALTPGGYSAAANVNLAVATDTFRLTTDNTLFGVAKTVNALTFDNAGTDLTTIVTGGTTLTPTAGNILVAQHHREHRHGRDRGPGRCGRRPAGQQRQHAQCGRRDYDDGHRLGDQGTGGALNFNTKQYFNICAGTTSLVGGTTTLVSGGNTRCTRACRAAPRASTWWWGPGRRWT